MTKRKHMAKNKAAYYYFKRRLAGGQPYDIRVTASPINTILNPIFTEMTDRQREFYLAHPGASVMEVWHCEIVPPYVPPEPDVIEYAAQKVKELKKACYAAVSTTSLMVAMALDKTGNITADSHYSITEARQVLAEFRSQSKHAMQVYDTYKPQIESASTTEEIDTLYEQATGAL